MSCELRNAVGAHVGASPGAKTTGLSEAAGWDEALSPEAFATTAPTTIAEISIVPSKTMEMEDRFIYTPPLWNLEYPYFMRNL